MAHEFAHALKRHFREENTVLTPEQVKAGYLNWKVEVEADEQAATWGYTIPKRRKRASKRKKYKAGSYGNEEEGRHEQ